MQIERSTLIRFLSGVVIALAIFVIVMAVLVASRWRDPLATPLDLPTRTPQGSNPSLGTSEPTTPIVTESSATPTEVLDTPTPTSEPVCGGPQHLIILVVGTDSRGASYLYGLGDVIRIVRADFVNPQVSVLSLPRDLWVEVPGLESQGITHGKLNQAFLWGTEGMGYYDNPAYGAGLLAHTLEHNFGLRADNYLTVNMRTFSRIVDALGGVFIYIPSLLDGRYDNVTLGGQPLGNLPKRIEYGYFEPGSYLMDGNTALTYARIRAMDNDFQRQKRQYQVLMALRDRALSPDIVEAVPEIIEAFKDSVLTDLSAEQISQLTCLGLMLEEEDIHLELLDEGMFESSFNSQGNYILLADELFIREIIRRFVEGSWPE
jgi:LCP family protein required for cell wall assembly